MMLDARERRFQLLVVYRTDRFARNVLDSRLAKAQLEAAGIRLVSVTEPIDDTPAGQMTGGIFELYAEFFSKELGAKVSKSLITKAQKGLPNGLMPFGYQQSANPKADPPVIIRGEADAVRDAFHWFATGGITSGKSPGDSMKRDGERGIAPPSVTLTVRACGQVTAFVHSSRTPSTRAASATRVKCCPAGTRPS